VDSYVKVYCKSKAPKGTINEIAGYALAKGDGLAVPQRAAVLLLSQEQAAFLPSGVSPHVNRNGLVVAWCVQSIGGTTPVQAFNLMAASGLQTLREDFAKWNHLPQVVSLDAWLLNEDRNMGNLVRTGPGRYALIDHGRICTGNAWSTPIDRAKMKHQNKVAWAAWGDPDIDNAPPNHRSSILAACARHKRTLEETVNQLELWFAAFLSSPEKDDLQGFFGDRAYTVGTYLRQSYGVLL
jgi:hypothetical protein